MKKIKILTITILSLLLSACSDKDEPMPENANDNFITAFSLTKDGHTYQAEIADDDIIITIPYTVDLDGATAAVTATSSATIYPDPATVNDWGCERVFRVVSYSGKSREYTYLIRRSDISEKGDLVLNTQAEVDAFPDTKINVVEGNLIIGNNEDNKITDLSPLAVIKEVGGTVIIGNGYTGNDITGIDHMEKIGGLRIGSEEAFCEAPIEVVNIHKAKEIPGTIEIYDNNVMIICADKLTSIGGIYVSSTALQTLQFDFLTSNTGDLKINGGNKAPYREFYFPELTDAAGTVSETLCPNLVSFDFPKLQKVGSIILEKVPFSFEKLSLPEILEITNDFTLTSFFAFQPIGSSYTFNEKLERLDGFAKLNKIGGTFRLEDFPNITVLPDLSHIAIHGIRLFRCSGLPAKIDLSSTTLLKKGDEPAYLYLSNVPTSTINGSRDMDCDFILFGNNFELLNIDKIGSLILGGSSKSEYEFSYVYRDINITGISDISFPELTYVGGYVNLNCRNSVSMPALTEVGGELCVPAKTSKWNMPKLTKVCTSQTDWSNVHYLALLDDWSMNLTAIKKGWGLYMNLSDNNSINMGNLKYIGGAGWYCNLYYSNTPWTTFGLPELSTVKGTIEIVSSPNADAKLTGLVFPKLSYADKVIVRKFKKLTDFSVFAPLFKNNIIKDASDWSVTECGYNPSYQDMKNGKYKK